MNDHYKHSEGFFKTQVLVGASANIELSGSADVNGHVKRGVKYTVTDLDEHTGKPGTQTFVIRLEDGHSVEVTMQTPEKLPAGGSINVAFVLQQLGVNGLGVIAPMGIGNGQQYLLGSLLARGVEHFIVQSDGGTARTLTVRDSKTGQSTLFCHKPEYRLSDSSVEVLQGVKPKVLILTSVKPADIRLVESLFENNARDHGDGIIRHVNAFVPNMSLIRSTYSSEENRLRLRRLIENTSLMQINELEAGVLLGKTFDNTEDDMYKLSDLGATVTVVTLGEKGAVAISNDGTYIRQPAYQVHVVDTSGAGDTHLATLMYCHVLRQPRLSLEKSLMVAAWVASKKVTQIGPWSGVPKHEEIELFIHKYCE